VPKKEVSSDLPPVHHQGFGPALKEFPYLNSSLDEKNGNIILKKYYKHE